MRKKTDRNIVVPGWLFVDLQKEKRKAKMSWKNFLEVMLELWCASKRVHVCDTEPT